MNNTIGEYSILLAICQIGAGCSLHADPTEILGSYLLVRLRSHYLRVARTYGSDRVAQEE